MKEEVHIQPALRKQEPVAVTLSLTITGIAKEELYPALLWLLADGLNRLGCFPVPPTTGNPEPGLLHPAYTVFHREQHTFSVLWTPYSPSYPDFLRAYRRDTAAYGRDPAFLPQGGRPANTFDVSMVPWLSFSAFHLTAVTESPHLLPIFTAGRWEDRAGRRILPLAAQVHPAGCSLAQVGKLGNWLQKAIDRFPETAKPSGLSCRGCI